MKKVWKGLLEFSKDRQFDIDAVAEGFDQMQADFYVEPPEKVEHTVEALEEAFDEFLKEAENEEGARKDISKLLNDMLDDLCDEDFFGTEAQCDPRGDHRD